MSKRIEIQDQDEMDMAPNGVDEAAEAMVGGQNQTDNSADDGQPNDQADELAAAREEAQQNYDRLLRVSAEFENYKKRTAREIQDLVKYANEQIIKDLLTVVDNLERAMDSASKSCDSDDPMLKGVHLTLNETLKILERHQVTPIKSIGEPFDPNFHQAMMQEEANDQPPNTVVKEMQKGYLIHNRLLRPSLVAVSKTSGA